MKDIPIPDMNVPKYSPSRLPIELSHWLPFLFQKKMNLPRFFHSFFEHGIRILCIASIQKNNDVKQ